MPAARDERVGQPQIALLTGLAEQLDQRELHLGVSVGPGLGPVLEYLIDEVGEATRHLEQQRVSGRPREATAA